MDALTALLANTLTQVWVTFTHNWHFLLASILIAALLKLTLDPQKVSAVLLRYRKAGVIGATVAAVTTPLCSCGTTAILLGMMSSMLPWAPIVAFMVASPLTSPQELVYSAGLFGWPFAIAFFAASILLGLLGGLAAAFLEGKGLLAGQSRFADPAPKPAPRARPAPAGLGATAFSLNRPLAPAALTADACCAVQPAAPLIEVQACACPVSPTAASLPAANPASCDCGCPAESAARPKLTPRAFLGETLVTGRRLLLMFFGFASIGYLLNGLIPAGLVADLFGGGSQYGVLLSATLGIPLYVNTEASLPLVRALIENGMSQGAALAFLITGAGTSFGALAGALAIARWRILALVIATLWVGAVACGYGYDLLLAAGLF